MITRSSSRPGSGDGAGALEGAKAQGRASPVSAGPAARVRGRPIQVVEAPREQVEGASVSSFHWSSSTNSNDPDNAWNVNFNDGNVNNDNKSNDNYVRAVRGGS